ncbi:unnamed protein product [Vitrella brassicaformis CCMP3155]|uniref:Uncharacterized protein n=1 Tax=Vitrella brassicaformis (strain CCMP3155) TaxID=1169540 RepID=A0A0G4F9V4_VITBC|nr:unnamed protein product [Vitrella brassicaformis CCMP3155]|eukprot:CEM09049.1 unnamed protein product [Vitrella brassicaformis CCMP3155]
MRVCDRCDAMRCVQLEGNFKMFALTSSSSAAAGGGGAGDGAVPSTPHLFVQRLYGLPPELHHTLAGWIGAEGQEATTLAQLSNTMASTSHAGSSAVETAVTSAIDGLIKSKRLESIIDYQPLRQSASRRRVFRLIRLRYVIEVGGDWSGSVALLRLAKNLKRIQQLPLQLGEGDVRRAGTKEDIDSRLASMRQYGLFGNRLDGDLGLTRGAAGEVVWGGRTWVVCRERLGGIPVRVHTPETVPAEYRDTFDPSDPPCRCIYHEYRSFREIVMTRMLHGGPWESVTVARHPPSSAASSRIGELTAQRPGTPLWGGRTIGSTDSAACENPHRCRFVLLRGDGPDDAFAVYVRMSKHYRGEISIGLYSTEDPHDDGGVGGNPQAAALARARMGSDAWLIPQLNQAIPTGGSDGVGDESGSHSASGPSAGMGATAAAAAAVPQANKRTHDDLMSHPHERQPECPPPYAVSDAVDGVTGPLPRKRVKPSGASDLLQPGSGSGSGSGVEVVNGADGMDTEKPMEVDEPMASD